MKEDQVQNPQITGFYASFAKLLKAIWGGSSGGNSGRIGRYG
jgi:hypothetical protein